MGIVAPSFSFPLSAALPVLALHDALKAYFDGRSPPLLLFGFSKPPSPETLRSYTPPVARLLEEMGPSFRGPVPWSLFLSFF